MIETVTFDGTRISDFYQVLKAGRPGPNRVNSTRDVPGTDGVRHVGSRLGNLKLTVSLLVRDKGPEDKREAMREIMSMVCMADTPRVLAYGSDNGLYYMAVPDGETPVTEGVRTGVVDVNFVTENPALYGETRSVTVPSGSSVDVYVGGTYPTCPKITGTVYGDSTSKQWGLNVDAGEYINVVTGSTSARSIEIDCDKGTATVAGITTLPTLDSNWLRLRPGLHRIDNHAGSGASTFTWQEMWI